MSELINIGLRNCGGMMGVIHVQAKGTEEEQNIKEGYNYYLLILRLA